MSENFSGKLTFEEKIIGYQSKLEEKSKADLEKKVTILCFFARVIEY